MPASFRSSTPLSPHNLHPAKLGTPANLHLIKMCRKSPAKLLRSIKRMTKFNEKFKHKSTMKKLEPLSVTILPQINIGKEKLLSFSLPTITNIRPVKQPFSEPEPEPEPEPSSEPSSEPLSLEDFVNYMKTSQEKLRIDREKDLLKRKEEREKDLIEFRNKLGLPPEFKPKL